MVRKPSPGLTPSSLCSVNECRGINLNGFIGFKSAP